MVGVLGLTKTDALDYAVQGIRVNCLCPGWIKSGIHIFNDETKPFVSYAAQISRSDATLSGSDVSQYDSRIARVPMGRWGIPEEVAYFASFVLSDKASFMTGASLNIDGGLTSH